jgi:HSP20 family protein
MANPAKQKPGNGSQQATGPQRKGPMMKSRPRYLTAFAEPWDRLRTEFDRLFDDFVQRVPTALGGERQYWGLDVQESDDSLVIRADAPGFDADDFDLEIRGDNLEISACQSEEKRRDEQGFRWQKREMYRSVPLPADVDPEKIDAQYRNGVLTVKLPKSETAKRRKIEVKS